jgi:uncharacterized protein YggE
MRQTILTVAALLALALPAVSAAAQENAPEAVSGTRLNVTAEGRVTRPPDFVAITAGVTTDAPNASDAIRGNAVRMERVRAALRGAGIADRDIRTNALNLNAVSRDVDNEPRTISGYTASNILNIRFRDIASSGRVIDALVGAGVNQINGPTLGIDRPEPALDEARTRAIATARARAELYARALGMRVKRVLTVGEINMGGGGYGNFANAGVINMADLAETEIAPGVQALIVNVTVSFELE